VAIVSQIGAGIFIDRTGHRLPMVVFAAAMQLVTASLLLVRNLPDVGIFTAHYLCGTSFIVNPLMYGWASTILQREGDDAVRGIILYTMAMGGQILYTFWGIVVYPATDAPYWKKGATTMVVVCFAFVGWSFVVKWVSWRASVVGFCEWVLTSNSLIGSRKWRRGQRIALRRRLLRWSIRSRRDERCVGPRTGSNIRRGRHAVRYLEGHEIVKYLLR
jgi:MFS family permease